MAIIKITEESRNHLVNRAQQRFDCQPKDAIKYIEKFIEVLKNQSPDDWRFTRSPVAKFLIYDQKSGFHILGRTYRDIGKDFLEKLKVAKIAVNSPEKEHQKLIQKLAQEYLEIIQNPNAEIIHELKTIYSKDKDIGELKHSYKSARLDLSHLIPINARRIATRPNAIVTENNELWVRQNELIKIPQEIDYLLFERLTKEGIDKSYVHIYTHDFNGNIKLLQEYQVSKEPIYFSKSEFPGDFHTASYWALPTYIDTIYLDLKYRSEKFPISLTKEESLLKFRIEVILHYLKEEMKWTDDK
jgi:hypothetical protein